jgi:hypothetical protein
VGRTSNVDEQETTESTTEPTSYLARLGKRCWGLPIFNEFGEKIHKIYSIDGLRNFNLLTLINLFDHKLVPENLKMIIILEKDKITQKIRDKLLKKGLSLVGMSDKEIIFNKLKHQIK